MKHHLLAGNVNRAAWPGKETLADKSYVNLYLGSGRFGGCFDAYGLMNRPYVNWEDRGTLYKTADGKWEEAGQSNTIFMHADHWSRGAYGLDYHLPIGRFIWDAQLPDVSGAYSQQLDLYSGRLTTCMEINGSKVRIACGFNPYMRDLFVMEIAHEGAGEVCLPPIAFVAQTSASSQYGDHFAGSFCALPQSCEDAPLAAELCIGTARTTVCMRVLSQVGDASIVPCKDGFQMRFCKGSGRHLAVLGVAGQARSAELLEQMAGLTNIDAALALFEAGWQKRWGDSWISLPVSEQQAFWARSAYYLLCTYAPDPDCVAPPNGWAGNGWKFHFPQDFSYIVPALLRLGHVDIAKAKVEFYHSRLDAVRRNTKRIYQRDGAMWVWEFPIGDGFTILEDKAPNFYQFEIHNAAYPARMAYETALHLQDDRWSREIAWPVVLESTRFYSSSMRAEADGRWSLNVQPSMGQDEAGGFCATNYLCSLFAAEYCLKTVVEFAEKLGIDNEETRRLDRMRRDGMAYNRLFNEKYGLYFTCEQALHSGDELQQKHPVQLNPLIFLPLERVDEPMRTAYAMRYALCYGVNERFVPGWTLGAYCLAACHLHDGEGMLAEFSKMREMNYCDQDMLQVYESSGYYWMPYYSTTHGLFLQALQDALVSDFAGSTEIGSACPDLWQTVAFHSLHTKNQEVISGRKANGSWSLS